MPKSVMIKPEEMRKKGVMKIKDIPVCQYQKAVKDEAKNYSKDDFMSIYHDMLTIRTF